MKHTEDDRFIRFNNQLKEGEDYYMENGYRVMKAEFLIRRGYCCGNGCRHCPYSPRHLKGNRARTD